MSGKLAMLMSVQKVDEDSAQDDARGRQTRHEQVDSYPASQGCLRIFSVQGQLCQLLLQCCSLSLHSQQAAAQPLQQAPSSAMIDHRVVVHLHTIS